MPSSGNQVPTGSPTQAHNPEAADVPLPPTPPFLPCGCGRDALFNPKPEIRLIPVRQGAKDAFSRVAATLIASTGADRHALRFMVVYTPTGDVWMDGALSNLIGSSQPMHTGFYRIAGNHFECGTTQHTLGTCARHAHLRLALDDCSATDDIPPSVEPCHAIITWDERQECYLLCAKGLTAWEENYSYDEMSPDQTRPITPNSNLQFGNLWYRVEIEEGGHRDYDGVGEGNTVNDDDDGESKDIEYPDVKQDDTGADGVIW